MASETKQNPVNFVLLLLVVALGAGFGYYYYQQQNKDTVIDINLGGKQFTAEIDQ
jgi:uncharacterized membrane protein YpjA